MKPIELIPFFEAKMIEDMQQYLSDKAELGIEPDTIGLLMSMDKSKDALRTVMLDSELNASEDEIDKALNKAWHNLFQRYFEPNKSEQKNDNGFKSIFVGTIRLYKELDKDDKTLDLFEIKVIAGKAPNALLIHREEAEEVGLLLDKSYLINCKSSDFGNDITSNFEYEAITELSAMDVINAVDRLGTAEIMDVK